MSAELPPEYLALAETRASLHASIAARELVPGTTADFRAVTAREKSRVSDIEARMKELAPAAFRDLLADEKPAPVNPAAPTEN